MGGVVLPGGGASETNVAYRAVPGAPGRASTISLPIGLIALATNPPTVNPDNPDFNLYELVNTLYNPPWNLQLSSPAAPSNDIVVELGRDRLAVQLGEISSLFPDDHSRIQTMAHTMPIGFGFGPFFAGAGGVLQYQNDLSMNAPLHAALADGQPFQTNTSYALFDNGQGQVAAALQFGWASPLMVSGEPRSEDGWAVYGGVRAKVLHGLAYGDAQNTVAFETRDTLLSSSPIDMQYAGTLRAAGPAGGGWGRSLDLGTVLLVHGMELGVSVNDLASQIDWKVEESHTWRDSTTGDIVKQVDQRDAPFTSKLPQTVTANAAIQLGPVLVAADVVHGLSTTQVHGGAEMWLGPIAVRGGTSLDANHDLQYSCGTGVKLGHFGVDTGVTTHNRNLSHERGVEMGVGLALYH